LSAAPGQGLFQQLIVKNAGHDVTRENNAQHTFDQIFRFCPKGFASQSS
jgi:hypothetical protein